MKLHKNKHDELVFSDRLSECNTIHLVHCCESLEEIKEDIWEPYLVAEECTNFPRIHLLTAPSEDEALQAIDEYLREKENVKHTHIIGVFKLEL